MLTALSPSTIIRAIPALAWMGFIFALSSQSAVPAPPALSQEIAAFVGHLVVYFVLALLLAVPLVSGRTIEGWKVALVVLIAGLYGVSDEIHQSFVPGRDASLFDVATDLLGALLAAMLLKRVLKRERA